MEEGAPVEAGVGAETVDGGAAAGGALLRFLASMKGQPPFPCSRSTAPRRSVSFLLLLLVSLFARTFILFFANSHQKLPNRISHRCRHTKTLQIRCGRAEQILQGGKVTSQSNFALDSCN